MMVRPTLSCSSHRVAASTWLCGAAAMALLVVLVPRPVAACGGTCGDELVPRMRFSGGVPSLPDVPANGWVYWRAGAGAPADASAATIVDTRDGSTVALAATLDATLGAYALQPNTSLAVGVTYEVNAPVCGSVTSRITQRFIATAAQTPPSGSGSALEVVGEGASKYWQYYGGPPSACGIAADGRFADVGIALDPALEPWRDSLLIQWRVDGVASIGSSLDGLYPRAALGASLAGVERLRLGVGCGPEIMPDGTAGPFFDHGFAAGTHRVEAFAYIAGASAPVALGSIEVTLSCGTPTDAGVDSGAVVGAGTAGASGCAVASRATPGAPGDSTLVFAALAFATGVLIRRPRRVSTR